VSTAVIAALAAVSLAGVSEPVAAPPIETSLISDAWAALLYVVRHPSLRGLAITLFISNLGFGVLPVGIPVLVLRQLHGTAAAVGQVFAVFGLAGLIAGIMVGRINSEQRERLMIAACIAVQAPIVAVLAFANSLGIVFVIAFIAGAASSVINVGIFALRQRRTAPSWFGRAFAVSLSLNVAGQPIGSALSGPLLEHSIALPFLIAAAVNLVAAGAALALIPRRVSEDSPPA
jgi:predicted MFS family arabinose efflux permease